MFKFLKNGVFGLALLATTVFLQANENEKIDWDSFKVDIIKETQLETSLCQLGNQRGIDIVSKTGQHDLKLFFDEPIKKTNPLFGKANIFLPAKNISSALLVNRSEEGRDVARFNVCCLYEADDYRNYVLLSDNSKYRVDVWTDHKGALTQISIIFLKDEWARENYQKADHKVRKDFWSKSK